MTMVKAVLINEANQNMLAARFKIPVDDKNDVLPLGYYLVTDFGNDDKFDTLTLAKLEEYFIRTGVTMDNNFFEVLQIKAENA